MQVKDDEPVGKKEDEEETLGDVYATLPAPSSMAGYRMIPAEFEKDDDSNHHIDVSCIIYCFRSILIVFTSSSPHLPI